VRVVNKGIKADSQEFTFIFNGTSYKALAGDSIASALINCGIYSLRQSAQGEKRGLFCGMGVCNECEVTVDDDEGELACMTRVTKNMVIETQRQIKRIPISNCKSFTEEKLAPDVMVIGGGPAGLASAATLAKSGLNVLVVDERSSPGGQYFKQPSKEFAIDDESLDSQFRIGRELIAEVVNSGVTVLSGVRLWAAFSVNHFMLTGKDRRWVVSPRRTIIATGAYEKGIPIPGWTLPGVMTTGAAQTLLRSYQVSLGRKVVISGNGPLNIQLAAELIQCGVHVVGIAESARIFRWTNFFRVMGLFYNSPKLALDGIRYFRIIWKSRTPFRPGWVASEMKGVEEVEFVTLSKINKSGFALTKSQREYSVDSVALGFGFNPSNEIARSLGCEHTFDVASNSLIAKVDQNGRSSLSEVWIVGDSGQISGAQVAVASGHLAAFSVMESLGIELNREHKCQQQKALRTRRRNLRFQKNLWKIFATPILNEQLSRPSTIICRCLSLTGEDISQDLEADLKTAGAVKRLKRVGMGKCQGRYCAGYTARLASAISKETLNEFSGFAPQIPFKPTEIGLMADPSDDETI
jgi:NADPH-dependent 2,4-dienoyl-CoA reductase/sulfur reductase-like enzyme